MGDGDQEGAQFVHEIPRSEWWKRKDGVEEVEEAGLVNKHIFWRSAGGNALGGRDMNS